MQSIYPAALMMHSTEQSLSYKSWQSYLLAWLLLLSALIFWWMSVACFCSMISRNTATTHNILYLLTMNHREGSMGHSRNIAVSLSDSISHKGEGNRLQRDCLYHQSFIHLYFLCISTGGWWVSGGGWEQWCFFFPDRQRGYGCILLSLEDKAKHHVRN